MDFLSFVAVALIILAVCVAMIVSYSQQARRLQAIQEQLTKIENRNQNCFGMNVHNGSTLSFC